MVRYRGNCKYYLIMNRELTEENFVLYAMKYYDNPTCKGTSEFIDDLKRFRYLKRLFRKYDAGDELKERLIINHIVVLYNLFGVDAATRMLFFKIEKKFWTQLKTFLVFLNYMPIGLVIYDTPGYDIPIDQNILEKLSKL